MYETDSLTDLRDFLRYGPDSSPLADTDEARHSYRTLVLDWLVDDGHVELEGLGRDAPAAGESVTLFVLGIDEASGFGVYAVPDSVVSPEQRAALDALGRAPVFCYEFYGDISPPQYPGALWTLVLLRPDRNIDDSEIERLGVRCGDVDLAAMGACLGAWEPYELRDGRQLQAPISHVYTVHFAM